jgi:hypothetical protein
MFIYTNGRVCSLLQHNSKERNEKLGGKTSRNDCPFSLSVFMHTFKGYGM